MIVWKKIKGYEDYFVSQNGEIKSFKNGKERLMKPQLDSKRRYLLIGLSKNGKTKMHLVHRIVADAFLDNPNNKEQVNHKNCNTRDNRLDNLEWVTREENQKHAYINGRISIPTFEGKFGKYHNRSIGYVVVCPSGEKEIFYSGLEFERSTGLNSSNLSYAARKKALPHVFSHGTMKGYILLELFNSYVGKS